MPCKEEEKNKVLNRAARYSIALLLEGLTAEEHLSRHEVPFSFS